MNYFDSIPFIQLLLINQGMVLQYIELFDRMKIVSDDSIKNIIKRRLKCLIDWEVDTPSLSRIFNLRIETVLNCLAFVRKYNG